MHLQEDDYFSVKTVARMRGFTPQAVRKAIKEKRLKAIRIANVWIIQEGEFLRWIGDFA